MRLIGITGGVGAGKTEILSFIRQHYNCKIYLADEVANTIQLPGEACHEKITKLLGKEILSKDGRIDKGKMAAKIFMDRNLLRQVNAIVHPAVKLFLEEAVDSARADKITELFFIEAALLIENGYSEFVDEMWYIYAPIELRRERLNKKRGYSNDKIDRIMGSQLSENAFKIYSDFIIDNSGTLDEAYSQIKKRLEAYTWQE